MRQKFRLYPTSKQRRVLSRIFGSARWSFNNMLELRTRAYKEFGESISLSDTSALLSQLKKEPKTKWLKEIPCQATRESLIDLDNAFKKFFRGEASYPRFKKKSGYQSFRLPEPKAKWGKKKSFIFIPVVGIWIRFDLHREILGETKDATILQNPDGSYYISIVVHLEKKLEKPVSAAIGIDLGLKDFAVMSSGEKIMHPKISFENRKD